MDKEAKKLQRASRFGWLRRSRAYFSPGTIPGWAVFIGSMFLEVLDFAHRFHFVAELLEGPMDPLSLVGNWGWLLGAAWIIIFARRDRNRPDAVESERRMTYLRDDIVRCIRRFESLVRAYEDLLPAGTANEGLRKARDAYFSSLVDVVREAVATAPIEMRDRYQYMLKVAYIECLASSETIPTTLFSKVSPPLGPLEQAIEVLKRP